MTTAPDYSRIYGIDLTTTAFNADLLRNLSNSVISASDITVTGNVSVDEQSILNVTSSYDLNVRNNLYATRGAVTDYLVLMNTPAKDENINRAVNIEFVNRAVSDVYNLIVDDSPAVLDTIKEIAHAVNNDSSYFETVNTKFSTLQNDFDLSMNAIRTDLTTYTNSTNQTLISIAEDISNNVTQLNNTILSTKNELIDDINNTEMSLTNTINTLSSSTDTRFIDVSQNIINTNNTFQTFESNTLNTFTTINNTIVTNANDASINLSTVQTSLTNSINDLSNNTTSTISTLEFNTNQSLNALDELCASKLNESFLTTYSDDKLTVQNQLSELTLNVLDRPLTVYVDEQDDILNTRITDTHTLLTGRIDGLSTSKADLTYVQNQFTNILNMAPEQLNSFLEVANQLAMNDNEISGIINSIANVQTTFTNDLSNAVTTLNNNIDLNIGAVNNTISSNIQRIDASLYSMSLVDTALDNKIIDLSNNVITTYSTKQELSNVNNGLLSNINDLSSNVITLSSNIDDLSIAKADKSIVESELQTINNTLQTKEDKTTVANYVSSLTNQINNLTTNKATLTYVDEAIAGLINASPSTLDTLGEIASQLQQDQNSITTILTSLGQKASQTDLSNNVAQLQTQINTKANKIYVDDLINTLDTVKANKSYVDTVDLSLSNRIDNVDITKANASELLTKVNNIEYNAYVANVDLSLNTITTSINSLDNSVATINNSITSINTELLDKIDSSDVALLVDNIETEILNLETIINTKATTNDIQTAITNLVNGASTSYDTLKELETALNNNESATSAIVTSLATKANASSVTDLSNNVSVINNGLNFLANDVATNYALKSYVDNAVSNVSVDLSGYVVSSTLNDYVQTSALVPYATKTYVDNAITNSSSSGGSGGSVDLSGYAMTSYVDNKDLLIQNQLDSLNTLKATYTYVDNKVSELVGTAPGVLDTIQELASALNNDSSFSSTVFNQIALKANDNAVVHLTGNEVITGTKGFNAITTNSINGISNTVLNYVANVSSDIQTQLDSKVSSAGGSFMDLTTNDQVITGNKTWNNLNSFQRIVERLQTLTVSSNTIVLDYSTGNMAYVTPPSATNLTLTLTNVPISTYPGSTFTVTVIINANTNKAYITTLTVNGVSYTMRFAGGSGNVSITSAIFAVQTITILVAPGSSTVLGVLSSVSQWF